MMGLNRLNKLNKWMRPGVGLDATDLVLAFPVDDNTKRSQRLKVLDRAIAQMSEDHTRTTTELRAAILRFRNAFEGGTKTLGPAWQVKRCWHNLRNLESALHTLCKERTALVAEMATPPL